MQRWSEKRGIILEFTSPGKPTQNGQVESFNGTMRDELLRGCEFENLREARDVLEDWRKTYNNDRPHSSLGYETPSSCRRPHEGVHEQLNLDQIQTINNNINLIKFTP